MEQRLIKILELIEIANPDVCVVVTDKMLDFPGPHILYVNKNWQDLTGYSSEEVIGKTPRILQGPSSCRETLDRLKVNLKANMKFEGGTVNYKKDGSEFRINWLTIESIESDYFIALQRVGLDQELILSQLKEVAINLEEKLKEYS